MIDPFNYKRRESSVVHIGDTPLGGDNPIRLQSMTSVSTLDTKGCVHQAIEIAEAGGEYVRLTAQGVREAENLQDIKDELAVLGYNIPLIADIHFNRNAAETAAGIVEKVRINPGNFVDSAKKFKIDYTEEEYLQGKNKIKETFIPFLALCKKNSTAIRIGVNHGSLSDRIMSRYGDTPEGMVESCMEFLRICKEEQFPDVVISIKASNVSVMVRTVRFLIDEMGKENMHFPLHLGVTEAGEGEDGRIKSAVGIGALLLDGIGDTIRVSLSEDPANEIPVAAFFRDYIQTRKEQPCIRETISPLYDPIYPKRRESNPVLNIGGNHVPVIISDSYHCGLDPQSHEIPDYIYTEKKQSNNPEFLRLSYKDMDDGLIKSLHQKPQTIILLEGSSPNKVGEKKAFIHRLMNENIRNPIVLLEEYDESAPEIFRMKAAIDTGSFFLDSLVDGLFLRNKNNQITSSEILSCAFGILQASGKRISKTEYISCPGCGRTLFDLQTTIRKVKEVTSHLTGLKIAIMGCIVNGPGEMADADYGYVGAGKGKISLYKGKECIKKNISEEKAVEELLHLINKA